MIKNIVFDLGGVLVPLNRVACLRAFNDVLGYSDFGSFLSTYRQKGFFDDYEQGRISSKEFRQTIRENIAREENGAVRYVTDSEIDYSLNRYLCDIPQDKIETLLFFKEDYRLYLLSNTNPIGMDKVRELFRDKGYDIEDLFVKLFLSYEMKMAKPNRDIFEKMLRKARINPCETLFIDDAPANVKTASEMGFKTILYNPKEDLYAKISEFFERE